MWQYSSSGWKFLSITHILLLVTGIICEVVWRDIIWHSKWMSKIESCSRIPCTQWLSSSFDERLRKTNSGCEHGYMWLAVLHSCQRMKWTALMGTLLKNILVLYCSNQRRYLDIWCCYRGLKTLLPKPSSTIVQSLTNVNMPLRT